MTITEDIKLKVELSQYLTYHRSMNHIKNFLSGARQVLVLDTGSDYVRPSRGDFIKDVVALRADARRIASDLNRVTKEHGKQIYNSKG